MSALNINHYINLSAININSVRPATLMIISALNALNVLVVVHNSQIIHPNVKLIHYVIYALKFLIFKIVFIVMTTQNILAITAEILILTFSSYPIVTINCVSNAQNLIASTKTALCAFLLGIFVFHVNQKITARNVKFLTPKKKSAVNIVYVKIVVF